jgi:hypothetical protein
MVLRRWKPWERTRLPDGLPQAKGWTKEVREVVANGEFAVLIRPLPDGATHAMISTIRGWPPTWAEKQRIKDTLFGARWAVECFPPRARLVDDADAYHLWVLPPDSAWPYDLKSAGPGDAANG